MAEVQHRLMWTTALGLLVATGLAAHAQETAQTVELSTVTILSDGSRGEGAGDNVASIDMAARNRDGGARKIDGALREVPGVFTRVNAGQPGVAVNVRGFEGSGRVNTTLDGVRQSFRFTGHEAQGFLYVDQNLLAGVDITRGASLGVGGGGLAGSANFRTLGVDDVVASGQSTGSLMRFGYGTNGADLSGMVATGMKGEDFDIVGAISRRNAKSFRNGDGEVVENSGQDLTSGLFKFTWHMDPRQSLEMGAVLYNNDFFANSYFQTVDSRVYTSKYRYDAGDGMLDFRMNASFSDVTMEYTGSNSPFASNVGRVIRDKGYGLDASNVSTFDLGGGSLRSVNGVEYFRDEVTSTTGGVNPADGTLTTTALFTDNVWTSGQWELSGGLRIDHYKVEGTAQNGTTLQRVNNSDTSVDPKLTAAYTLSEGIQPYLTWSRSMRAPTTQETMLGGVHPGGAVVGMVPNPDLRAETSQGWELGVNLDRRDLFAAGDRLSGRIATFRMDVEDYIISEFSPAAGGMQFVNAEGTSKTRGAELELNYDIGRYSLGLGYTYTNSDLPSQMPGLGASQYLPDDIVTLSAAARFLDDTLTVGGTFNHVSSGKLAGYSDDFTGGEASHGGDSYNLVDVFAVWKASDKLDLNLRVTNLFDEQYTPFLSTSGDGQGRAIYAGGQLRF